MSTLQNKTVVVVGGSSGIGFAVALAALQSQASTVIIASSNAERVAGAVKRLESHKLPGEVRGEVLDARDTTAVKEFSGRIGIVDHVAWTSGDVPHGVSGGDGESQEARTAAFAVRFWGPLVLAQNIKFGLGGSLTITTGSLDIKPRAGRSIHSGVAASLEGLTKGLAVDLAPLRVNVVSPSGINTEIWDRLQLPAEALNKLKQDFTADSLIKRIGEPEEIAEAYIFLMKQAVTTQTNYFDDFPFPPL